MPGDCDRDRVVRLGHRETPLSLSRKPFDGLVYLTRKKPVTPVAWVV
jgi:hypothetical protein